MTKLELLLTSLSEECAEVHQRCSKAVRFGLDEVQVGQEFTNAERIAKEYADLIGVYEMLQEEFGLPLPSIKDVVAKKAKVERWLAYSAECGTLALPATEGEK